MYTTISTDC